MKNQRVKPRNTARNNSLVAAAGVAALAGTAYFFRKEVLGFFGFGPIAVAPHIAAKLPIAKDLQTVPDFDGNYDIDGVSFDTEGVVVGGDRQHENIDQQQVHH